MQIASNSHKLALQLGVCLLDQVLGVLAAFLCKFSVDFVSLSGSHILDVHFCLLISHGVVSSCWLLLLGLRGLLGLRWSFLLLLLLRVLTLSTATEEIYSVLFIIKLSLVAANN